MRLHPIMAAAVSIFITVFTLSPDANAAEAVEKESVALTTQQQIKILQTHITQLTQKVSVLNRNQQSIAQKIGLTSSTKQPKVPLANSASLGKENAKVVLVEFTDLHCPFCKKFHNNIFPELEKQFIDTGKLRFVGKHYPIVQLHKNAAVAAFALECARNEGDYKKAKAWLFKRGKKFNKNNVEEFTKAMDLDHDKFSQCVASPATATKINNDMAVARQIGVNQTPSFAIGLQKNGQLVDWKIIKGAESVENFGKAIAEFTALAESEG